jgi:pilus assembly protein Flp/PilA
MLETAQRFWADESGASAIEYGLLAAVLGLGMVYSLTNLQLALTSLFEGVKSQVPDDSAD